LSVDKKERGPQEKEMSTSTRKYKSNRTRRKRLKVAGAKCETGAEHMREAQSAERGRKGRCQLKQYTNARGRREKRLDKGHRWKSVRRKGITTNRTRAKSKWPRPTNPNKNAARSSEGLGEKGWKRGVCSDEA